jgi:hypothetical protein
MNGLSFFEIGSAELAPALNEEIKYLSRSSSFVMLTQRIGQSITTISIESSLWPWYEFLSLTFMNALLSHNRESLITQRARKGLVEIWCDWSFWLWLWLKLLAMAAVEADGLIVVEAGGCSYHYGAFPYRWGFSAIAPANLLVWRYVRKFLPV